MATVDATQNCYKCCSIGGTTWTAARRRLEVEVVRVVDIVNNCRWYNRASQLVATGCATGGRYRNDEHVKQEPELSSAYT